MTILSTCVLVSHSFIILCPFADNDLTLFAHSIRRRALDLLYGMCDFSNAKDIVEELLQVNPAGKKSRGV